MLSKPSPSKKALHSGVILKLKRDASGNPARSNARLVVDGIFQSNVLDCTELYASKPCNELVRLVRFVAASKVWDIEQLYVKGAFLHAMLHALDCIWIRLLNVEGVSPVSGLSVQLLKSLYGIC